MLELYMGRGEGANNIHTLTYRVWVPGPGVGDLGTGQDPPQDRGTERSTWALGRVTRNLKLQLTGISKSRVV